MKLGKVLPILAVSAFCLAGCASKTDYANFNEKAKAVKAHPFVKATVKVDGKASVLGAEVAVKGTIHYTYGNGWAVKDEDNTTDNAAAITLASAALAYSAVAVGESDDATYYVGGGFRVVYKNGNENKFNEFGLQTYSKSGETKISISYSK